MTQTLNVALCKVTPLSGSFHCWHNTCRQCQTTPPRTQTHTHTQSAVLIMTKSRLIWKGLLLCFRQTLTSLPPPPYNAYAHPLYCLQRMKTTLKVRIEAHFADAPSASSTNCSKYGTCHDCVGLFGHPINTPWLIIHVNCYVDSPLETLKRKHKAEKTVLQTLWGDFSSLWTPAIWLIRGISSLKVYSGGLVGSGKLVLLNGSVSSRNWTLHTNVAMVHPCKSGLDQENGGCAAAASDRQAGSPPGQRTGPPQ